MADLRKSGTVADADGGREEEPLPHRAPDVGVIDVLQEIEGVGGADNTAGSAGPNGEPETVHEPAEVAEALDRLQDEAAEVEEEEAPA